MAAFDIIASVNEPGTPGKTGDDRFGFDAGAGTAWVLDGATDATDLKPFPGAESGAAWLAEEISARLMTPPPPGMASTDYWQDVLTDVRAKAARVSTIPLADLPPEAWPIASGIWMQRTGDALTLGWMGDCFALDLTAGKVVGHTAAAEDESAVMDSLLKLSEAEQWAKLRAARAEAHTTNRAIFSLLPEVANKLSTASMAAAAGQELVLMSDGYYRLLEPYRLYGTPDAFAGAIREKGLMACLAELRAHEDGKSQADLARIKTRDDACALHLRLT